MSVKLIPENVIVSNQTMEESPTYPISISNQEGIEFLNTLPDNSVDLILTDPPYIISRDSGMNSHYNKIKKIKRKVILILKLNQIG